MVSGGVTGTRTGWLKTGEDSAIALFDTKGAADARASELNARARAPRPLAGGTVFRYWAEEYEP
jgi:hypothetical protein